MPSTLHLTVRTPEAEILDQEVNSVKIMTEGGEIEIFPHHASLTGKIAFGKLDVRTDNEEHEFLVKSGVIFVSVESNSVQLLCFSCQEVKDVDYKSAAEYLKFVEEKLAAGSDLNEFQIQYLENEKIAMVQQMEVIGKE